MSRFSHRGGLSAFSAVACLVVAFVVAAGGEPTLVVGLSTAAGGLAGVQAGRDLRGTTPSNVGFLTVAVLCGLGVLGSLPGERWFTALALAGVAAMNFGHGVGWRVPEADDGPENGVDEADGVTDDANRRS